MQITESNLGEYTHNLTDKQRHMVLLAMRRHSTADILKRCGELAPQHVLGVYQIQTGDEGDKVIKTLIALVAQGYIEKF